MLINEEPHWPTGVPEDELLMFPELNNMSPFEDDAQYAHLPADDFLEALNSDLEIPLLCDESADEIMRNALETQDLRDLEFGSSSPSSVTENEVEFFAVDEKKYLVKREFKNEPSSPASGLPPSPSPSQTESLSSVDWQSEVSSGNLVNGDVKFALETPPISPPQNESPPESPKSAQNGTTLPQIKLIPLGSLNLKDNLTQRFILSNNPAKRICLQPKLDKPNAKEVPKKTIVLSPHDFAALTQRVKQNGQAQQPLKVQALPMSKYVKIQNQLNLLPANKIAATPTPLIVNALPSLTQPVAQKAATIAVPNITNTTTTTVNTTEIKPTSTKTIVIQKECPAASRPTPIVVKNEFPELIDFSGRYDSEIKAFKRQQRMIKNRESACLSRKKKKEHLMLLETRVDELMEENKKLQMENEELRRRVSELEACGKEKNFETKAVMNKKNTALLLAMVFMVSFNIGGLGGLGSFNQPPLNDLEDSANVRHGRTLLWALDDDAKADRSKPIIYNSTQTRNEPMYKTYFNQTESTRLYTELSQLIVTDPSQNNWIDWWIPKTDLEVKSPIDMSLGTYPVKTKTSGIKRMRGTSLRKSLSVRNQAERKPAGASSPINNAVQVFSMIPEKYAELFNTLGHRKDTFYLVLSSETIRLPASSQNSTAMPRISLILPTIGSNSTPKNHVTIMQIDCEVINTRQLNISNAIIPEDLRNQRSSQAVPPKPNDTVMSERVSSTTENIKPYFLKESSTNSFNTYTPENEGFYNANQTFPDKEEFPGYFSKDVKNNANIENYQKEIKEFANITEEVKNKIYSADRQMYRKKPLRSVKQVNLL